MEEVGAQVAAAPMFTHQSLSPVGRKRKLYYQMSNHYQMVPSQLQHQHRDEWNSKMWDWDCRRFEAKPVEAEVLRLVNETQFGAKEGGEERNLGSGLNAVEDTTAMTENTRPNKKIRSGSPGGNYPMCQVDNCSEDLSHAKDYHRRHKVCEVHSKATKALVGKHMQRFCQQCSRFHLLSEFDEGKRSCRRRLAGHNRRRRKTTQPEEIAVQGNRDSTSNANMDLMALLTALACAQGKNEVKPMGSPPVPAREQLLQILNKINALALPMDLVSKLNNIGSLAKKNLDHPIVNPQNDTSGDSPSTMDLLAVLSETLGSSSPDTLAILSQGGFGNKDSDRTKLPSYENGVTTNLEKKTFGFSSVWGERSSSSNQSPSQDSDSRAQDNMSSLSLQLFTSSPEDESRPTVASYSKYYSSASSNPVEDRSPSSSPIMQELFPLQTSPETMRSKNHNNTSHRTGCLPLDLFGASNRGAANPNFKGFGQLCGYASSGSDYSPPSLNSDAQDRTGKIVFKLLDKDPSQLPGTLRSEIYNWLSNIPSEMESYIRPGCVVLSVYVAMSPAAWEQLEQNLLQRVGVLLQNSRSDFWRNARFLVNTGRQLASHKNGRVRCSKSWRTWNSPELISVSPIAVVAGEEKSLIVRGRNLTNDGISFRYTHMGSYMSMEVTGAVCRRALFDELSVSRFKVENAHRGVLGRCFIEVENGFRGDAFPLIIANASICKELNSLEGELYHESQDMAFIFDDLSCTNQQESEHDEISGLVEKLPSHAEHEDAPSEIDTSVNLDDIRTQGNSENNGVDTNQKIQDDCNAESEEVTILNEISAPVEKIQENNNEEKLNIGGDVCLNTAEEKKEIPTGDLSGNVSHESAETLSMNINGPSSLSDSKTAVSELAESSAEAATKSEVAQSVKECTETHVASPIIEDGEINRVVNSNSDANPTKTTPDDVCEDIAPEEASVMETSDIKERSAINTDDEVDSDIKSFDSTKSPLLNNDIAGEEDGSREEKNETSSATASVASETKSSAQDRESEVVTSNDTIHTGAKDSVESQSAENKEGEAADRTDDTVASTGEIGEAQKHLPSSTIEGPASEGHTVVAEIEKRPFYFLPRVPRYDDEKLAEQLKHAEDQVDQKTKSRDALRADIQNIRATCKDSDISYKAAMAEERSARKAMHSKRQEIEALQSVISRVKSAASVDDIDSRVHNMEHMIQHETLSLSEEKGLIRELKQLRQLREQISSSMGTKDEVKQALDDKEKTEERLKVLRKELDALRNDLSKAEVVTKAAKKKCDEEWEAQSKLQEKFRAADAIRQEAFAHLQDLKKQQREKNKYFFKYRDDSRAASEMALKKDRAALQRLCSDQVENFMNMWNNDEEFRKYYVRCNTRSTVRRLGTLDGRSLGPDEEPPRITYATRTDKLRTSSDRTEKHETAPPVPAQQEKVVKDEGSKVESNDKPVAKPAEQKSQTAKSKKTVKPEQPPPIVKESVSVKEEIEKSATKEEEEPPKLTKEEEELIKKEEEKRKQKEAAKMKEQLRLEEIAKAKEAMERKKKREEKAKARAALKAQKEVEEREKEREKKLRKKERRKGIITSEETTETPTETSETVIETPREIEIPKKQTAEEKKSHKPSSKFLKQNKSKSIPLPLRNRGSHRKLRQWMWIGLAVAVALALFLLGNANLSFSPENLWFI